MAQGRQAPPTDFDVRAHYTKYEYRIPMRDGKKLFTAAKTGGVKNYFVEMDFPTLQPSCAYLQNLAV